MRRVFGIAAAALCALCLSGPEVAGQQGPAVAFQAADAGKFPPGWKAKEDEGRAVYTVRAEAGEAFLHAESARSSHTVGYELTADPAVTPRLRFAWRPLTLPPGGDERAKATNDSALAVYVIFEGWGIPPKSIKYVWSTTLAPGTSTESPYSSRAKVAVLRSGPPAAPGAWVEEEVDVAADYRRLFGERGVPRVQGIAVLTDSDNTGSRAAGDYRFFAFGAESGPWPPVPRAQATRP